MRREFSPSFPPFLPFPLSLSKNNPSQPANLFLKDEFVCLIDCLLHLLRQTAWKQQQQQRETLYLFHNKLEEELIVSCNISISFKKILCRLPTTQYQENNTQNLGDDCHRMHIARNVMVMTENKNFFSARQHLAGWDCEHVTEFWIIRILQGVIPDDRLESLFSGRCHDVMQCRMAREIS